MGGSWSIRRAVQALRERPASVARLFVALLRGTAYVIWFRLFRRDVRIRLPFLAFGPVLISGPGRVRIGPYCVVFPSVFRGLSIVTLTPEAEVFVGARSSMGGLVLRARHHIELGERTQAATALIQDCLICDSAAAQIGNPAALDTGEIVLGDNVWLSSRSLVLPGSRVASDAVLAVGAMCMGAAVDNFCLVAGNPAGRPLPIPRLMGMKTVS